MTKPRGVGVRKSEAQTLFLPFVGSDKGDLTSPKFSFIIYKKGMIITVKCSFMLLYN